jgi:hypothetical protein
MAQRTWRLSLLLSGVLLTAALGACGDPDPVTPIAGPSGTTASAGTDVGTSPAPGASAASPTPEVLKTKDGAPTVCTEVQQSKLADKISTAIRELATPGTEAVGKQHMTESVTAVTALAAKADGVLKQKLTALASALTVLAQKGMQDATTLGTVGTAASELDEQILATCGFPFSEG